MDDTVASGVTPGTVSLPKRRLCTVSPLDVLLEVPACTNLLHNPEQWQSVCATGGPMLLGYARVSKGEEQETTFRAAGLTRAPR